MKGIMKRIWAGYCLWVVLVLVGLTIGITGILTLFTKPGADYLSEFLVGFPKR